MEKNVHLMARKPVREGGTEGQTGRQAEGQRKTEGGPGVPLCPSRPHSNDLTVSHQSHLSEFHHHLPAAQFRDKPVTRGLL